MTLNEKVDYKTVIECVKELNIFIGLKKDLFGCFRIEEIRDKGNEPSLKEEGRIQISNLQCFLYTRCTALSLSFKILTYTTISNRLAST